MKTFIEKLRDHFGEGNEKFTDEQILTMYKGTLAIELINLEIAFMNLRNAILKSLIQNNKSSI